MLNYHGKLLKQLMNARLGEQIKSESCNKSFGKICENFEKCRKNLLRVIKSVGFFVFHFLEQLSVLHFQFLKALSREWKIFEFNNFFVWLKNIFKFLTIFLCLLI